MKALLLTKCGCSRMIEVLHQDRTIVLPIIPHSPPADVWEERFKNHVPLYGTRMFKFQREERDISGITISVYHEV